MYRVLYDKKVMYKRMSGRDGHASCTFCAAAIMLRADFIISSASRFVIRLSNISTSALFFVVEARFHPNASAASAAPATNQGLPL